MSLETMMWIEEFEKQCLYIRMSACIRKALILSAESIQPSRQYLGSSNMIRGVDGQGNSGEAL